MEFNGYIWKLYRESQAGQDAIKRFSNLTPEFAGNQRFLEFEPYEDWSDGTTELREADLVDLARIHASEASIDSIKHASDFFSGCIHGIAVNLPGHSNDFVRFGDSPTDWYDHVGEVSLGLHLAHPQFFVPYMFRRRFDRFEKICHDFGIPLPPIPGKGSKEARAAFYCSVNHGLYEFRISQGLSPAELCAFLYDFSEQYCQTDDTGELPLPTKVWLVSGGTWDFDDLDCAKAETVLTWGGHPAIRRGDIVLMYCVAPRSYIHSIWRACSDGFADPFSHYHGNVAVGRPIKTRPITYAEMASHELLSKKPEIRAHLQGTGGKPFSVPEYEAILELWREKGETLSGFPRIPLHVNAFQGDLLDEADVEIHLIEPFLKRLGFCEDDWIRQLPVKMGRGERNYPDYAIGAKAKRGEERAKMLVEAKFQLSAHRDFEDAYYQAKFYALRLQSKVFVLAAIEGIWIFQYHRDDFEIKRFSTHTWAQLHDADLFHSVSETIGRRAVFSRTAAKSL